MNEWTITWSGGSSTKRDQASIDRYGGGVPRSQSKSVPFTAAYNADQAALYLVNKYSTPMLRITSLVPDMSDGDTAAAVFDLDLFEPVAVNHTPPGGTEGQSVVRVQKIELAGQAGSSREGIIMSCRYGLAAR